MERFLTAEQVAQALQVHLNTVRHWLRTGQISGRKIGRVWRISESELRQLGSAVPVPAEQPQEAVR